jgi:hypothetical protein
MRAESLFLDWWSDMTSSSKVWSIEIGQPAKLADYKPENPSDFLITLNIMIGLYGDDWSSDGELFRLVVCTPNRLYEEALRMMPCLMLSGYLVIERYEWSIIESMILDRFDGITRDSSADLMIEFSSYAAYAD